MEERLVMPRRACAAALVIYTSATTAGPWRAKIARLTNTRKARRLDGLSLPPANFVSPMVDKPHPTPGPAPAAGQSSPSGSDPKHATDESASARTIGQRGSDARDAMTEMAERAQLISQEAGTKIASAMKDVIGTAAGIAGFAVESARDLVQFMVRRGQITHDEAEKLIRQAEEAHGRHTRSTAGKAPSERSASKAERPSREVPREETKPAASAAKRASGATAAAKPEKKAAAKRPSGAKKVVTKPSTPKKKR